MNDERQRQRDGMIAFILVLIVFSIALVMLGAPLCDGQQQKPPLADPAGHEDYRYHIIPDTWVTNQVPDWSGIRLVGDSKAAYRHDGEAVLNDLKVTPGAVDDSLIADPSGDKHLVKTTGHLQETNLCAKDFHTGTVRNVDLSVKKQVCAEYGQKGCPSLKDFEIDHLISIEIGGSNDIRNLWPQPVDARGVIGFHTKDKVENALHRMVCSGRITLPEAQKCISQNWYACAVKYKLVGTE